MVTKRKERGKGVEKRQRGKETEREARER